jgi:hypothetical protein
MDGSMLRTHPIPVNGPVTPVADVALTFRGAASSY